MLPLAVGIMDITSEVIHRRTSKMDEAPAFWLQLGLVLVVVDIWGLNQKMEGFSPLSPGLFFFFCNYFLLIIFT